jgi:predicted acyl esterase
MSPWKGVSFALLAAGMMLAGCVSGPGPATVVEGPEGLVPVPERHLQPYNVTGYFSHTVERGAFGILPGVSVDVPLTLPVTSGAQAAAGQAVANLGLFLPKIEGCDWSASSMPASCKVPVVADVGPYYMSSTGRPELNDGRFVVGESDTVATEPAARLGKFLIDNLVPHGYAVAQVSVLGTGDSSSCQDLMGPDEQAGIDAAVTWLGTQPWSNGAVGLIGRSYDGSTPWEAAMFGNPHLKTIVPISGLTGQHDLMWRNGSSETRGPGVLYALYAAMTIDGEAEDALQVLCPDYLTGVPQSVGAYLTGGRNDHGANSYWTERHFLDRALANYKGSVYAIHGLQDWNVDPHMIFPAYQQVLDAGLEAKGLFGQWAHMYPDRPSEHVRLPAGYGKEAYPESVRYDWAQDLLEWFDHYLKGTGPKPALHVEVQDNQGGWRIESTWPPANLSWAGLALGSDLGKVSAGEALVMQGGDALVYEGKPLAAELRLAGLVRFPVEVTPMGPGGQLFARLYEVAPDGELLRLGHAVMDLRYAAGGSHEPTPVAPGIPLTAKMEFEAIDAVVPAGHRLRLVLLPTGEDYLPSDTSAPVRVDGGTLWLPTQPEPGAAFTPPAWSGKATATAPQP